MAIADYNRAIRLDSNDATYYSNRAVAYYYNGDLDLAIADHNLAIRLDSNNTSWYNKRGDVYYNKGDFDLAIADFEASLRINPTDPVVREKLESARKHRKR